MDLFIFLWLIYNLIFKDLRLGAADTHWPFTYIDPPLVLVFLTAVVLSIERIIIIFFNYAL